MRNGFVPPKEGTSRKGAKRKGRHRDLCAFAPLRESSDVLARISVGKAVDSQGISRPTGRTEIG